MTPIQITLSPTMKLSPETTWVTPLHTPYPVADKIGVNAQIDCTILIATHNVNIAQGAVLHGHAVDGDGLGRSALIGPH